MVSIILLLLALLVATYSLGQIQGFNEGMEIGEMIGEYNAKVEMVLAIGSCDVWIDLPPETSEEIPVDEGNGFV